MGREIRAFCDRFRNDTQGAFAVWFALMALPLMLIVTIVIDIHRANKEEQAVLTALDAAAIIAVQAGTMTDDDREEFAREMFDKNYDGKATVVITVATLDDVVKVTGKGEIPTAIAGAMGVKEVAFEATSKALRTERDVICVLALDETSPQSLSFLGNASFKANNCSVQVNSSSPSAVYSSLSTPPEASSFCAVGGAQGNYSPFAKGLCSEITDPYINRRPGDMAACEADLPGIKMPPGLVGRTFGGVGSLVGGLIGGEEFGGTGSGPNGNAGGANGGGNGNVNGSGNGSGTSTPLPLSALNAILNQLNIRGDVNLEDLAQVVFEADDSNNVVGDNAILYPGTYCGGLTVIGQDVRFMPGKYTILNGKLNFKRSAEAAGAGVTFVHKGIDSILRIEQEANVTFSAQETGPLAGFVFFQDVDALSSNAVVSRTSEISGNGQLNLTGTLYLPEHALIVNGSGDVGSASPVLSFIAKRITFDGDAQVTINVDEGKVNYPPVLPRSDEGARLIQ